MVYLLTLDLGLDIVNCIGRLHLEGDSLAREGLDENLHVEDLEEVSVCKREGIVERLTSTEMSSSTFTMQKSERVCKKEIERRSQSGYTFSASCGGAKISIEDCAYRSRPPP